jgi:hypothetical protein
LEVKEEVRGEKAGKMKEMRRGKDRVGMGWTEKRKWLYRKDGSEVKVGQETAVRQIIQEWLSTVNCTLFLFFGLIKHTWKMSFRGHFFTKWFPTSTLRKTSRCTSTFWFNLPSK